MTRDRLARLLEWADAQECVYGNGVKRLADERNSLLEVLRELLARTPLTDSELAARVKYAKAAIAYTESP